jgi:hypothetical protein
MKTAVEWLKEQYVERGETLPSGVFQEALEMERDQLKEIYLNGIENYDPTFKRKSQWTPVSKKEQKQHIVDIMKADEEGGLYNDTITKIII